MFNSITWAQYFSSIIFILIIYYILVAFRFYKWEILGVIGIRKVGNIPINTTVALSNLKETAFIENSEPLMPDSFLEVDISPLVQSFREEVSDFVRQENEPAITKGQIINSIREICSKYPAIKNADCRNDLELEVINEINLKYPSLLQRNDVKLLWN